MDTGYLNSARSALLEGLSEGCIRRDGSLADCFILRPGEGMLKGDPVVSLTLKFVDVNRPEGAKV